MQVYRLWAPNLGLLPSSWFLSGVKYGRLFRLYSGFGVCAKGPYSSDYRGSGFRGIGSFGSGGPFGFRLQALVGSKGPIWLLLGFECVPISLPLWSMFGQWQGSIQAPCNGGWLLGSLQHDASSAKNDLALLSPTPQS